MSSRNIKQQMDKWDIWSEMLESIKSQVTRTCYRTWFEPVDNITVNHELKIIHLSSIEEQVNSVLNARYLQLLESAVESVLKVPYRVIIDMDISVESVDSDNNYINKEYNPHLMNQYTFENFVVGEKNRLAHGIAWQVAKAPSLAFNPLFIYSNSGLGKTHLLHAIGNYVSSHDPQKKIIYVSSEEFTTDLVDSLRSKDKGRMGTFKRKYRGVDVLLIDDIQFLEGKPSTQEEFFHVFNDLYNNNKQIVICSDKEPAALIELEDRLRSRFQWNMVVGIAEPDYETRVAILKRKAQEKKLQLTEPVIGALELIAGNIENIRELEGALTRLTGFSAILDRKITPDFVRETLTDILEPAEKIVTSKDIKEAVCKKFNVKIKDLDSAKRSKDIVVPRHIAMYLCREVLEMSFEMIGREFGNRNHTTVITACDKLKKTLQSDKELELLVLELISEL